MALRALAAQEASWQALIDRFVRTTTPAECGYVAAWALDCGPHGEIAPTVLAAPSDIPARPLGKHEIFLWLGVPSADEASIAMATILLDTAERTQANAFAHRADRASYVAAHAMARRLLGRVMGYAPDEIRLARDAYGKPYIRPVGSDAAPHVSISHGRGLVAVALGACPVGIDIEQLAQPLRLDAIAEHVLSPDAHARLLEVDAQARPALFLRFWTLGEAFIKATGLGLAQDLRSFTFTPAGEPRLLHVDPRLGPAARWRFGII
ncbi:4'-phosphopantetheinyl transferase family protein [Pseudorhodoplanes sp.]|uniref:4'-phosphopantetheinyl transferase family protein n=1 Tax=Pseudorhodoplanes sp. TaxID=1934341 RepID=UPI002BB68E86|nr:4'-phosphopantetheinyl transferase superfamily protein [Pseudorhodoplanes sp.]HWK68820.1 4'-phosphopantetheinyl transferase superfamily protein [Rhizobiaceae bacterium]HWV40909.1 4'-phosphopantetheinyl transferase superfamily protein [Pseudorhodoplanes sp.]